MSRILYDETVDSRLCACPWGDAAGGTAGLGEAKALEKLRLSRVSDDVKRCSYDDRKFLTNG